MPADLSKKALFIDEAHHASADGLSQIVNLWRERGGQLFFFTATPYRGDDAVAEVDPQEDLAPCREMVVVQAKAAADTNRARGWANG